MLRVRSAVLIGQTAQHRLGRTPPGEVVARSMDADRLARYADRWVDFVNGLAIAAVTAIVAQSLLAGGVLLAVMVASALASSLGRRVAGRSAAASAAARARFGRSLVSTLDSVRTVKLAASTPSVHAHLREVDAGRVDAAVREHRVQALLDGVPIVMVQCGVVTAWALLLAGEWGLATALLVAGAVNGFDWFGRVAGSVITEAPGTRAWMRATSRLAGGGDLMDVPDGVDLVRGSAPAPVPVPREPLHTLELVGLTAVHDDGTIGASERRPDRRLEGAGAPARPGRLGQVQPALGAGRPGVPDGGDPLERRDRRGPADLPAPGPGRPRGPGATRPVRHLHRQRAARPPRPRGAAGARDGAADPRRRGRRRTRRAGRAPRGPALRRTGAAPRAGPGAGDCDAELLLADDVSSALDSATEIELWAALRQRGATVIGATSKRAALAQADRVVVLVEGRVAAVGPWSELQAAWGDLAG